MGTLYFAINRSTKKAVDMNKWSLWQVKNELQKINNREALVPVIKRAIQETNDEAAADWDPSWERFCNRMVNHLTGIGLPFEMIPESFPPSEYEDYTIEYGIFDSGWVGHQLSRHLGV